MRASPSASWRSNRSSLPPAGRHPPGARASRPHPLAANAPSPANPWPTATGPLERGSPPGRARLPGDASLRHPGYRRCRQPAAFAAWRPPSVSAILQAATLSAGTASSRRKGSNGAVSGRSKWGRSAKLCRALCGRDARAPGWCHSLPRSLLCAKIALREERDGRRSCFSDSTIGRKRWYRKN